MHIDWGEGLSDRSMACCLSSQKVSRSFWNEIYDISNKRPSSHGSNEKIKKQLLQCFLLNGVILGVCIYRVCYDE